MIMQDCYENVRNEAWTFTSYTTSVQSMADPKLSSISFQGMVSQRGSEDPRARPESLCYGVTSRFLAIFAFGIASTTNEFRGAEQPGNCNNPQVTPWRCNRTDINNWRLISDIYPSSTYGTTIPSLQILESVVSFYAWDSQLRLCTPSRRCRQANVDHDH